MLLTPCINSFPNTKFHYSDIVDSKNKTVQKEWSLIDGKQRFELEVLFEEPADYTIEPNNKGILFSLMKYKNRHQHHKFFNPIDI